MQRKASAAEGRPKKRRQLTLTPKGSVEPLDSDASTLAFNISDVGNVSAEQENDDSMGELGDFDLSQLETPGEIVSDGESLSSLGEDSDEDTPGYTEDGPMRDDMPIVTTRWNPDEVEALMTALNTNRDAVKFHFEGPGGGKDIKRRGWTDVVCKYFLGYLLC